MSGWTRFRQWCYPPEFRIEVGAHRDTPAALVSCLSELADRLEKVAARSNASAADPEPSVPAAPAEGGIEKGFVIDLCNYFHRLGRAAKPFQESISTEGTKLTRNLDQMRKLLRENGIDCVDLTGHAYETGWLDFEMVGEPQSIPELKQPTVIQCERPLVRLQGKVIQPGKGIVGRPPI